MDGAALRIHVAEGGRWLTAPRRPATLQRARSLRPSLDDKSPEIIYVESRMLPTLFDRDGELLTAFRRWFRVFIVVNVLPGGKVLIFIIGWPFYQYLAMLLITTMAFQLRMRRNPELGPDGC